MIYVLDTDVVSELRRKRPNKAVVQWISEIPAVDLSLSVLVIGELRQGVERLRRSDRAAARQLDRWVEELQRSFSDRLLPVTATIAELWGRLNATGPRPVVDTLMAATAIVHGYVLVTRNQRDVETTGVQLLNPFG